MAKLISPIISYFLANNMAKDYTSIEGEMSMLVQLTPPTLAGYQEAMYFDSQTMLDGQNATITGIELVNQTELAKTPNGGYDTIDSVLLPYGILYISDIKNQIIAELPLTSLQRSTNNGKLTFTNFNTQLWANCYVEFAQAPFSSPTIPLLFNIYYIPKPKN
jgi:hypothetical protein